uniref:Ubiquitin-protein ligase n=1 Tax=Solanum tuberosum TaxID=4113 RepID=M1C3Z6_SOLTU
MEMTNLKKQKVTEEEAPQGISKLPDLLLVQILSLLPTKDAFRTCLISPTWRRLPTLIDSFNFTCSTDREREDFSFIQNALAHSLSSKIIKFKLDLTYLSLSDCSFRPEYETLISGCFSFAVERQVENVVLWSQYSNGCTLPESLCTCSSLITLDVKHCGFNNAVISWNSLKSIKLGHLMLTDDEMVKLLSGCPALETMELYSYTGFHRLEINSLKLKTLRRFRKAKILFGVNTYHPPTPPLAVLDDWSVDFLVDSRCNSELLDLAKGDNMDLLSGVSIVEFHNLKEVKIVISPERCLKDHVKWGFEKLSKLSEFLLLNAPVLEKFVIISKRRRGELSMSSLLVVSLDDFPFYFLDDFRCKSELLDLAKGDDMDLLSGVSSVEYHNLKKVKIVISSEACLKDHVKRGFEKVSKLLEFLLLNALVLENFVIVSKKRRCETCSINCLSQFLSRLADNLLGCPRSSTNSEIIFHE